jgi:hypothetical protein
VTLLQFIEFLTCLLHFQFSKFKVEVIFGLANPVKLMMKIIIRELLKEKQLFHKIKDEPNMQLFLWRGFPFDF